VYPEKLQVAVVEPRGLAQSAWEAPLTGALAVLERPTNPLHCPEMPLARKEGSNFIMLPPISSRASYRDDMSCAPQQLMRLLWRSRRRELKEGKNAENLKA
jgi:hypothetical protein